MSSRSYVLVRWFGPLSQQELSGLRVPLVKLLQDSLPDCSGGDCVIDIVIAASVEGFSLAFDKTLLVQLLQDPLYCCPVSVDHLSNLFNCLLTGDQGKVRVNLAVSQPKSTT